MDTTIQAKFDAACAAIRLAESAYDYATQKLQEEQAICDAHLAPYAAIRAAHSHSLQNAREALRKLAADTFACTQQKALPGGVRVREMTRLRYDAKVALQWAMEHRMALELAKKEFETIAKASKLDFVTEERYSQVMLPASFLGQEEAP